VFRFVDCLIKQSFHLLLVSCLEDISIKNTMVRNNWSVCGVTNLLQYVMERDANTLLPQFLGMYRVTLPDLVTHLVVMRCIFSPHFSIHCKYDLKATVLHKLHCLYNLSICVQMCEVCNLKIKLDFSCVVIIL